MKAAKILLVHSDSENRLLLQSSLNEAGHQIVTACSGLQAIKKLSNCRFDLVVTDISIGEFDGWRLTRIIRSGIYSTESTVPIIVVTQKWCERITEITAREFGINYTLALEDHQKLANIIKT